MSRHLKALLVLITFVPAIVGMFWVFITYPYVLLFIASAVLLIFLYLFILNVFFPEEFL